MKRQIASPTCVIAALLVVVVSERVLLAQNESSSSSHPQRSKRAEDAASPFIGKYRLNVTALGTKQQDAGRVLELRADMTAQTDDGLIGRWKSLGGKLQIDMPGYKVLSSQKQGNQFTGILVREDGERFRYVLKRTSDGNDDLPSVQEADDPSLGPKIVLRGDNQFESAPHGKGNVYAAHVIIEGGKFRMWYGAQGKDGHDRICYAESNDGQRWSRKGMVLDKGSSNHVNDPYVVKVDGRYFMFFTRADRDVVDQIDVATSADGRKWQLHGVVIAPGRRASWDSLLVGRPAVIYEDGQFKMWFDGRKDLPPGSPATNVPKSSMSVRSIGYATSKDGRHWTRYERNPIFGHDAGAVDVKRVGDKLVMLYESREGTRLASSRDGIDWSDHGLLAPTSGHSLDKFGHVTPFLLLNPKNGVHYLYVGAASVESWDQHRIGLIEITQDDLDRRLGLSR